MEAVSAPAIEVEDLDDSALLEAASEVERRDREVQLTKLRIAYAWCVRHPATIESGTATWGDAGLPGIGFGQDPIEYNTHTHHTNLDTYERVIEEDVKKAAVIVASTIYHLAMRDEMLPRFAASDMPAPPPPRSAGQ